MDDAERIRRAIEEDDDEVARFRAHLASYIHESTVDECDPAYRFWVIMPTGHRRYFGTRAEAERELFGGEQP